MHHQSLQNIFEEPLSIWQWFCIGVITILYYKSIFIRLNEKSPPLFTVLTEVPFFAAYKIER
jgi:hypothetical protein